MTYDPVAYNKAYLKTYNRKRRIARRKAGLCIACNNKATKSLCPECMKIKAIKAKAYRATDSEGWRAYYKQRDQSRKLKLCQNV